jgi:hypothetical protein
MKSVMWRGTKIFVPADLNKQEEDEYVRSAISSLMRWKPKRRRRKNGSRK